MAKRHLNLLVLNTHTAHNGGSEVMSLQVAEAMHKLGHTIILAYRYDGGALPYFKRVAKKVYKVALAPAGFRNPFPTLLMMGALLHIVQRHAIDVCFSSDGGLVRATGILNALSRVACVYHVGGYMEQPPNTDAVTRWAALRTSAIIYPSAEAAASWQKSEWAQIPSAVCPNWTDTDKFCRQGTALRNEMRVKLGIEPNRPVIIFVGRVCTKKGIGVLLDAVAILNREGLAPSVLIVGDIDPLDPPSSETAATMLDMSRRGDLRLVRSVNDPEKYYAVADIAVLPTIGTEGFGLALIEAMASELVVLASRAYSIPEIIGHEHADLLFEPGSPAACANRLRTWLRASESDRSQRGSALRQRIVNLFSSRIAEKYEKVFYQAAQLT
jgi:glycosyltransferase involved in cell wall biosynthesis